MPQRNVATNFTFEQQRLEINLLAQDFWTQKGTVDTAASTYLKHDGSNAFTGQTLAVPNAFTINSNSGNGTVTIAGNLQVDGTTTTVNTATMDVVDKNITIAKGSANDAAADGAGITIDSATDITWNFVDAKDAWVSSIGIEADTFLKAPYGQFTAATTPTTGQGVEINAPDANTGQISSYDRGNNAYKDLRLKGASVAMYAGTTNALIGGFHNTGLTLESGKTLGIGVAPSSGEGSELAVKGSDGATNIALVPGSDTESSQISFYNAAYDSTQGYIKYNNNDNSLQFRVNLQPRFHIKNDGDIAIGHTSPTARLDVRRGDDDGLIAEFHQNTGYGIDIGSSTSDAYIASGYNQSFIIKTDPSSGQVERFRITNTGDLFTGHDIQSGNPGQKIGKTTVRGHHVNSAGSFAELYLSNSFSAGGGNTPTASIRGERDGQNYGTALTFYTNNTDTQAGASGDGEARLRITSGGKVTIGNDHSGAATWDGDLVVANSTGGRISVGDTGSGERFDIAANGDINLYSYLNGDGINFHTTDASATTKRFNITTDGTLNKYHNGTDVSAAFPGSGQVNGVTGLPSAVGTPFIVAKDTGSGKSATFAGSVTTGSLVINGSAVQNHDSSDTNHTDNSLPSASSGFYIRNGEGTTGTFAALGLIASSTGAASDQSASLVVKCTASGLSPEVYLTQRDGNNSQRNTLAINTLGDATFIGTVSDHKGDLRIIPRNAQSSTYTLVASDSGKCVRNTTGGWIIPANVFSTIGQVVTLLNASNSDQTINASALAFFYNTADGANIQGNTITLGPRAMATIWFEGTDTGFVQASNMTVS